VFDYRDCILVITKKPAPVIGVDATIHQPSETPLTFVQAGASSMD
jgi:hypothetical protein